MPISFLLHKYSAKIFLAIEFTSTFLWKNKIKKNKVPTKPSPILLKRKVWMTMIKIAVFSRNSQNFFLVQSTEQLPFNQIKPILPDSEPSPMFTVIHMCHISKTADPVFNKKYILSDYQKILYISNIYTHSR